MTSYPTKRRFLEKVVSCCDTTFRKPGFCGARCLRKNAPTSASLRGQRDHGFSGRESISLEGSLLLGELLIHALSITTDPLFDPLFTNGAKVILDLKQLKNSGDALIL